MDASTFNVVLVNRDDTIRMLREEKDDLRQENRTLRAERRRDIRLAARVQAERKRRRDAEAAFARLEAVFPRHDPRPFLAIAGISCEGTAPVGQEDEAMVIAELRERLDAAERRIAQLTGEVDGLHAQVAALAGREEDDLSWLD
jgi:hypothetical protein